MALIGHMIDGDSLPIPMKLPAR